MADEADYSADNEIKANEIALRKHFTRYQPAAEYNEKGEKICIDCGIEIPKLRAVISGTVRCIDCQRLEERP